VLGVLIYAEYAVRLTPPGSSIVAPLHGVQGRLFLPMFAAPMVTVALLRKGREGRFPTGWLLLAVAVMAFYLVVKVFIRFY
jgi:hypothetical protein